MSELPGIDDIHDAAGRIAGLAVRTPLLSSPQIDARFGAQVLFKPECLQRTGSFKFRGACNAIASLSEADAARGVVAFSSGNHAQGVAAAATAFGSSAKIVMPADAPAIKLGNTAAFGGEVITYDRYTEDRAAIAAAVADAEGRTLIPPFDYGPVIAGQGTVGLEIAADLAARDLTPDIVLCPCGGGGLIAGMSLAVTERFPDADIWAVEPDGYDDTMRSLRSGTREQADTGQPSICDALLSPSPGELTFAINERTLAGGIGVAEDKVREAMRVAFLDLKLVVEPGGAVGLAALLSGQPSDIAGKTVVVVISGGNVDAALFADVLGA